VILAGSAVVRATRTSADVRVAVPLAPYLQHIDVPCPECDEPLELLDGYEMGSQVRRYPCLWWELYFGRHASGLLTEVEDE
jgi:hypothetical protein